MPHASRPSASATPSHGRSSTPTIFDAPGFFPFAIINLFALIILLSTTLLVLTSPVRWAAIALGTLTVLWCIVPLVWYRRLLRAARRRELVDRGHAICLRCGYDLAGLDVQGDGDFSCPECGQVFDAARMGAGTRR